MLKSGVFVNQYVAAFVHKLFRVFDVDRGDVQFLWLLRLLWFWYHSA